MKNCDWLINNQCFPEARAAGGFAVYTLFQKAGYFYYSKHKKTLSVKDTEQLPYFFLRVEMLDVLYILEALRHNNIMPGLLPG